MTAVVVALVVATTAAVVARLGGGNEDTAGWTEGGPVRSPFEHGYLVQPPRRRGVHRRYGTDQLEGDQPAVLRRVEIVGPSVDHFKVVGVLLAGPHRKIGSWQVADGFPSGVSGLGKLVPAEGARLAPGMVGSVLQIELQVVKPGLGIRSGVRLYYTVGGRRHTVLYPASIANCPRSMTDQACQDAYPAAAKQS